MNAITSMLPLDDWFRGKNARKRVAASIVMTFCSGITLAFAQSTTAPATSSVVAPSIRVSGAVSKPETLTAEVIESRFAKESRTITYLLKGAKHTAHAVPLLTVLEAAEPRVNPNIKHHELQFLIEVRGHDNYTVDFSLAELLTNIGNRSVWLALDEDGKPFTGEDGPVGLIVPDDVKPARWVHGVVAVTVIDGAATAMPR